MKSKKEIDLDKIKIDWSSINESEPISLRRFLIRDFE